MSKAITLWRQSVLAATKPRIVKQLADRHVLRAAIEFCEKTRLWEEKIAVEILDDINAYQLSSSNGRILTVDHANIGSRKIYPTSENNLDEAITRGDRYDGYHGYDVGVEWRRSRAMTAMRYYVDKDRIIYLVPQPTSGSDAFASLTDLTFDATGKTITSGATDLEDEGFEANQILIATGSGNNDRVFTIASVDAEEITVIETVVDEGTADATAALSVNGLIVWAEMAPTRVDNTNNATEKVALAATTLENFIYSDHYETIRSGALARIFKIPDEKYSSIPKGEYHEKKFIQGCKGAAKLKKKGYAARTSMDFSA